MTRAQSNAFLWLSLTLAAATISVCSFQAGRYYNDEFAWRYVPKVHRVEAPAADTAALLAVSDKLSDAFMALIGCHQPTTRLCNIAIGWNALPQLTTGSRNVALGPGAADWITSESDHVVIGDLFDCDVKERRCWYLGTWRLKENTL